MSMNDTPRSERLHIGLFGRRNAGKSSLINALTGQETALVSDIPGTTTDPVYKAMELHGFGPVVFIDTPGLDDEGELGSLRVTRTMEALDKTDIAIYVFDGEAENEARHIAELLKRQIPVIAVVGKCDLLPDPGLVAADIFRMYHLEAITVSADKGTGIEELRNAVVRSAPERFWELSITGDLAKAGDTVLLVMPQDREAPKGRLILPQAQTIRELLDKNCVVTACTPEGMDAALSSLSSPPKLIITDSQAFKTVFEKKPAESLLTSFSILFAAYKGDIRAFINGAEALKRLDSSSRVLIAEACAHAPAEEDIGRVRIPALLRKKFGESLRVDFVRGRDFPEDLTGYDLIIHCGACMFNRRQMMARIAQAEHLGVPICNYGITLACLNGILDQVSLPGDVDRAGQDAG
ncbi:MAG: [Clostridia bacterium]|nr:[FeFe] hydrogenase H-cluster maturation GTPase HydF [Clostridia bacterium]